MSAFRLTSKGRVRHRRIQETPRHRPLQALRTSEVRLIGRDPSYDDCGVMVLLTRGNFDIRLVHARGNNFWRAAYEAYSYRRKRQRS